MGRGFLAILVSPYGANHDNGWRVIGVGGAGSKATRRRQRDLLRPALEDIIDLGHPLVRLTGEIDWRFLGRRFSSVCTPGNGAAAVANPASGGAADFEAHAQPVGCRLSDVALCAR